MKQCFYCSDNFEPTVSRQIYCSDGCRQLATKEKAKQKRKPKRKNRVCANKGCSNLLSIYNDSNYCQECGFSEYLVIKEIAALKRRGHAKGQQTN